MLDLLSRFSLADTLTLLSIAAGFLVYFLQRQRKRLGYRVFSANPIPPHDRDHPEHEVAIEYVNIGNVPLVRDDFVSPITTEFTGAAEVLGSREFVSAIAEGAPADISHLGREGLVTPLLLNPGESVRTEYRVRRFARKIRVRGRIIGVTSIVNTVVSRTFWTHVGVLAAFYAGFVISRIRARELVDHYFFLLMVAPYSIMAFTQIRRAIRDQYMF